MALRLRALVLALGELSDPPWWRTRYLSPAGLRILERLYPRTAFSAAIEASRQAACALQDESIGRRGVFHLFRLPNWLESDIHRTLTEDSAAELRNGLQDALGDRDALIELLQEMADETPGAASGPWRIGEAKDLDKARLYSRTAGGYLWAFRNDQRIYPYCVETAPQEKW